MFIFGLLNLADAESQWTAAAPHCPPPRPDEACGVLTASGGGWLATPWGNLVIGLGAVAVGALLIALAERGRRHRATPLAA